MLIFYERSKVLPLHISFISPQMGSQGMDLHTMQLSLYGFPFPPLHEQTAIVEYLDARTAKIDAAVAATRREIELLREYRERLIADVVTGKLDVREVAARLLEK